MYETLEKEVEDMTHILYELRKEKKGIKAKIRACKELVRKRRSLENMLRDVNEKIEETKYKLRNKKEKLFRLSDKYPMGADYEFTRPSE